MSTFQDACDLANALRAAGFVALIEGEDAKLDSPSAWAVRPERDRDGSREFRRRTVQRFADEMGVEDAIVVANTRVDQLTINNTHIAGKVAWAPEWLCVACYARDDTPSPCLEIQRQAVQAIAASNVLQMAVLGAYALGGNSAIVRLICPEPVASAS